MPTPPAWRRIQVPTRSDAMTRGAPTYQDLVGRYLCKVALSLLNSRHVQGKPPLQAGSAQHVDMLADAMTRVAESVFRNEWGDYADAAGRPARFRLDHGKLLDGIRKKAAWALQHWSPDKVEGRQRGGRHGAASGVRKGRVPRWTPGLLAEFEDLPVRDRKIRAMAELGCSASTYHDLWKRYIARKNVTARSGEETTARLSALARDLSDATD